MGGDTAVKLRDMSHHLGNNIAYFNFFILNFLNIFKVAWRSLKNPDYESEQMF